MNIGEFRTNVMMNGNFRDECLQYRKGLADRWDYNAVAGILIGSRIRHTSGQLHYLEQNIGIGQGDNGNHVVHKLNEKGLENIYLKYEKNTNVALENVEREILSIAPEYQRIIEFINARFACQVNIVQNNIIQNKEIDEMTRLSDVKTYMKKVSKFGIRKEFFGGFGFKLTSSNLDTYTYKRDPYNKVAFDGECMYCWQGDSLIKFEENQTKQIITSNEKEFNGLYGSNVEFSVNSYGIFLFDYKNSELIVFDRQGKLLRKHTLAAKGQVVDSLYIYDCNVYYIKRGVTKNTISDLNFFVMLYDVTMDSEYIINRIDPPQRKGYSELQLTNIYANNKWVIYGYKQYTENKTDWYDKEEYIAYDMECGKFIVIQNGSEIEFMDMEKNSMWIKRDGKLFCVSIGCSDLYAQMNCLDKVYYRNITKAYFDGENTVEYDTYVYTYDSLGNKTKRMPVNIHATPSGFMVYGDYLFVTDPDTEWACGRGNEEAGELYHLKDNSKNIRYLRKLSTFLLKN